MKILGLLFLLSLPGLFYSGCDTGGERKIKVAATNQSGDRTGFRAVESVLQLDTESRHSIVILPFKNATGDSSVDWLSRGLADMLTTELSQSNYLKIISSHDLPESAVEEDSSGMAMGKVFQAAGKQGVKSLITGSFVRDNDVLIVETQVYNVGTGSLSRTETVSATGLERIFSMVDGLSDRLVAALRVSAEPGSPQIELTDITHSVEAFKCYSKALERMEQFSHLEADACLDKALDLDTTFAKAYLMQAKIKLHLGKHKMAEEAVYNAKRHLKGLSETERAWVGFMEAELEGDSQKLLSATQGILQMEPQDIDARLRLAELLFSIHEFEKAARQYELVLEIEPGQKLAYNQLGYVHAKRGDVSTGLEYLDRYAQLAPDEPNPYDSKGEILMQAGRFEEAIEQLKIALSKRPDFYHSAMRLAQIYAELGDYTNAQLYTQHWLESAAGKALKANAILHQASIEWRLDHPESASRLAMEALEMDSHSPHTILKCSEMFLSFGDTSRALRLQEDFLSELEERISSNSIETFEVNGILRFFRESMIPAERTIRTLDKLTQSETRRLYANQCGTHLGVLNVRAGNLEDGVKYLSNAKELINIAVLFENGSWSDTWKYHSEIAEKLLGKNKKHLSFYDDLRKASHATGRLDLKATAEIYDSIYSGQAAVIDTYRRYGIPLEEQWQICGPFANRNGYVKAFAPENQDEAQDISWQESKDGTNDGYVNLRANFVNSAWSVAYGRIILESDTRQKVQLRLGTDESSKLWLNNQLISSSFHDSSEQLDRRIVSVVLKSGRNDILLKVANSIDDWGFYFRATGDDGLAQEGVRFIHPGGGETVKMALAEVNSFQ